MSFELDSGPGRGVLCGIPAITHGEVEGHPALISALGAGALAPPGDSFERPLTIVAHPASAPHLTYPLWAFWLRPRPAWERRFPPMRRWLESMPAARRESPLLVLARAQGQWDFHSEFRPNLPSLLYETDPLTTPNGRVLVFADLPEVALRDSLTKVVRWFFRSMDPASTEPLPVASILVRSGPAAITLERPFDATVHLDYVEPIPGDDPRILDQAVVTLPHAFHAQAALKGSFVWGAWRGDAQPERFLNLTSRGAFGVRTTHRVIGAPEPAATQDFADRLRVAFPQAPLSETPAPGAALIQHLADSELFRCAAHLLVRTARGLERHLSQQRPLSEVLSKPYGDLARSTSKGPLSLFQSGAFPKDLPDLPVPGTPEASPGEPASAEPQSGASPLALLETARAIRVVFSNPLNSPLRQQDQLGQPVVVPLTKEQQKAVEATAFMERQRDACRFFERIVATVSPIPAWRREEEHLSAELVVRRPSKILVPALHRLPGIEGRSTALTFALRDGLGPATEIEMRVELQMPTGQGWRNRVVNAHRRQDRRANISVAIQQVLRTWVPVLSRVDRSDFWQRIGVRSLLLYEHSQPQTTLQEGEMVNDPRERQTVQTIIRSARMPLYRIASFWNRRSIALNLEPWEKSPMAFRNRVVREVDNRRTPLCGILVEESKLCECVQRLLVGMSRVMRSGKLNEIRQAALIRRIAHEAACAAQLAAHRIVPHGRAEAVVPLLVLGALHAAALRKVPLSFRYTFTGYDAEGKAVGVPLRWEKGRAIPLTAHIETGLAEEDLLNGFELSVGNPPARSSSPQPGSTKAA